MNTKKLAAIAGLSLFLLARQASAEFIIGVKGGLADYDEVESDKGINTSLLLGYEFLNLALADLAIEGEISKSVTDGERMTGQAIGLNTKGIYTALRTAGPVYFIGRVGYASTEIDGSPQLEDDTGTSTGIGIGFSGGIRFELELTRYKYFAQDIQYLTLGISF